MKIRTQCEYPPIPDRRFDWCAYDDDTYEPGCPIGHGITEEEAIADFLEQIGWGDQGLPDPEIRQANRLGEALLAAGAIT